MRIHELGHVVLFVSDLERSANFYRDTLGFHELQRLRGAAVFSGGRTHHELLLIEVGNGDAFCFKFVVGAHKIFVRIPDFEPNMIQAWFWVLAIMRSIVGTADHTVTHSLYILDPDGNELELYADVSDIWKMNPHAILSPTMPLPIR